MKLNKQQSLVKRLLNVLIVLHFLPALTFIWLAIWGLNGLIESQIQGAFFASMIGTTLAVIRFFVLSEE